MNLRRLYGSRVWHHVTEWDMHISLLSIPSQTIFFLAFWQQDIPGSHGERSSHGAPYLAWETTPNGGRCGVVRSTQSWPNTSYNVTAVIVINIYVNQKIKSKVKFGFVTQNLHVNLWLPQSVGDRQHLHVENSCLFSPLLDCCGCCFEIGSSMFELYYDIWKLDLKPSINPIHPIEAEFNAKKHCSLK